MTRNYMFFICIVSILQSCYTPKRDCSAFKTGTFQFESYLNGALVKSTFIRNDSIEIEVFQGKRDTASIRWVNNCEYILKDLSPKNMAEEKPLQFRILSTQNNAYTFEYSLVGSAKKQKGTAQKIE